MTKDEYIDGEGILVINKRILVINKRILVINKGIQENNEGIGTEYYMYTEIV